MLNYHGPPYASIGEEYKYNLIAGFSAAAGRLSLKNNKIDKFFSYPYFQRYFGDLYRHLFPKNVQFFE
jgi:hypothetical protein